jgi:uncharacterized repeat protein (TIGR04138 family)
MPKQAVLARSVEQVACELGAYPIAAFHFVEQGLAYTVRQIHATTTVGKSHHVSGQELAEGLREVALHKWGMLAGLVLSRWKINATIDFGRIVYAMIDAGLLAKNDTDALDDFRDVYDFADAFEVEYKITPALVLP